MNTGFAGIVVERDRSQGRAATRINIDRIISSAFLQ
jgi:hypothetical protein